MMEEFKTLPFAHRLICIVISALLLLGVVCCGLWEYVYAYDTRPSDGSVALDIPKNATGGEIGDILEKAGIVRSAVLFRAALFITGDGAELQSGHYRLQKGMTMEAVVQTLQKGVSAFKTVTIPEGTTVVGMQDILSKAGLSGADGFAEEAASYGPLQYMYGPEAADVKGEGFLFPDTYDIPDDYTPRQICDLMYRRTDQMLDSDIRERAAARKISLHDLMTIASMVEKEARFKEDQVPIASVILTRLSVGMPLQIDATVQYALGQTKENLTNEDTRVQSPYNTYLRQGLPPGPIAAPGRDAILAVLDAEPGEYLYYVAKADGHHVFTKTYDQHNAEIGAIYGNQ